MMVKRQPDSEAAIFQTLRDDFAFIEREAAHVRIRHDRLADYAASLPDSLPANTLDAEHHFIGTLDDTIAYILTLDSVNFGSGYKAALEAEGWDLIEDSLYFTVSTRLKAFYEANGVLSAETLAGLKVNDYAAIVRLDVNQPYSLEFANLCVSSLNEVGRYISMFCEGSFSRLLDASKNSASRFVSILGNLRSFHDVYDYHGRQVAFYKRAQSAAADLQDALRRFGITAFHDIDGLTVLADNDVPHVLHTDGILEYVPALSDRIAAGIPLPSGSEEEIEIRGCAARAAELIAQAKGMMPITLDRILWHRATEDSRYARTPSHRTLFRFY